MSRYEKKALSCKVLILGESNVGKSSIATRFLSNNFDFNKYTMSGAYQNTKSLYLKDCNKLINFEIWNTPGQKKFRILHRTLYTNTNVFILVYDITNYSSFAELKNYWINEIKNQSSKECSILIYFLILYF